ncbi:MAG: hypothetical protein ACRCX7_12635 [Cetobacterium sp.]|uniref:hypothetical protein n=1 Tax=Cetobacterium sp. TaxID=2071632 RepID=UPI003F359882
MRKLVIGNKSTFIELTLKETNGKHWETFENVKGIAISICGSVKIGEIESCGQCQDSIEALYKDGSLHKHADRVGRIVEIWNEWHLNDLKAGTKKQTEYLNKVGVVGYDEAVKALKDVGLYEDSGYRYGSDWLFNPAPNDIAEELIRLFDTTK